jgi:uncharacterized protein YoxC
MSHIPFYDCPNTVKTDELQDVMKTMGQNTVELQITTARLETQVHAIGDSVAKVIEELHASYDKLDKRISAQESKNEKMTFLLMFLSLTCTLLVMEFVRYAPKVITELLFFIK